MSQSDRTPPSGVPGPEEHPTVAMGSVPDADSPQPWPPVAAPTVAMGPGAGDQDVAGATQVIGATQPRSATTFTPPLSAPPIAGRGVSSRSSTQRVGLASGQSTHPAATQYQPASFGGYPASAPTPALTPAAVPMASAGPATGATPVHGAFPSGGQRSAPPKRKERLGAGWIAFIVADALLVVTALIMAFNLLSDSSGDPAAQPSSPAAVAPSAASTEAAPNAAVQTSFASPTQNITCDMAQAGVTCIIRTLNSVPTEAGCTNAVGYEVKLSASGTTTTCLSDASQVPDPSSVPQLAYDQHKEVGEYSCTSTKANVSCKGPNHGVSLSRSGVQEQ